MKKTFHKKDQYIFILVLGDKEKDRDEIIHTIQQETCSKILMIHNYKVKKASKFLQVLYSNDDIAFKDFKKKTKHFIKRSSKLTFIFLRINDPQYDVGEDPFEKKKPVRIKEWKKTIEAQGDTLLYLNNSSEQTDCILKYIGFKHGIDLFKETRFIKCPYHIRELKNFTLKKIKIDQLLYNQLEKKKFHRKTTLIKKELDQMPHYKLLNGDPEEYETYYKRFSGKQLKDAHSKESLIELSKKLTYLQAAFSNHYILVKKYGERYLIQDGSHRSAILKHRGEKEIIVAIIE